MHLILLTLLLVTLLLYFHSRCHSELVYRILCFALVLRFRNRNVLGKTLPTDLENRREGRSAFLLWTDTLVCPYDIYIKFICRGGPVCPP
jgi:hypothetical protein